MSSEMRQFDTGATRNTDKGKLDYEGFLHPSVLKRYAEYLAKHQVQADGKVRDSDNWQKGIPKNVYIKSLFRHFMDFWSMHRAKNVPFETEKFEEAICAVIFNAMGYLFEELNCKVDEECSEPLAAREEIVVGKNRCVPTGKPVRWVTLGFESLDFGEGFYWLHGNGELCIKKTYSSYVHEKTAQEYPVYWDSNTEVRRA